MSEMMIIAIINLVTRVGFGAASVLLQRLGKPHATLQDAIDALNEASAKSAEDYLKEARARMEQFPTVTK
jgi:hypothetical protein